VSERATAKAIALSTNFDVAFVIDKTGSMSSYIQSCKDWSVHTAKAIRAQLGNTVQVSLRMAVVFYSGFCCRQGPAAKVVGFGTPEEISHQTAGERTEGGCGSSADVWGGLRKAVDLGWRNDAQKMIFLILLFRLLALFTVGVITKWSHVFPVNSEIKLSKLVS
jgi:hypothetical protein